MLPGESYLDAARRELGEELDIHVAQASQPVFVGEDPDSMFRIHFVEAIIEGTPRPSEHSELRWVGPDDLKAMAFAPVDARFVREYVLRDRPPHE